MDVILQFDGVDVSGQRNCDANGTCFERVEIEIVPGLYVSIDIVARDDSFSDAVSRLQYVVPEEQSTPSLSDDIESNSGGTWLQLRLHYRCFASLVGCCIKSGSHRKIQ